MAELLAASTAVGVASGLLTFCDVAWRIVKRCNEYNQRVTDVPAFMRHIVAQLPVIIEKVQQLKVFTNDGSLVAPKSSLAIAIVGCDQEINRLELLAKKLMPLENESKWRLTKRAFRSAKYDEELTKIWTVLQSYVSTFMFHLAEVKDATQQLENLSLGPTFSVPFERDQDFVGRAAIIEEVNERFQSRNRVALAGIGGIGKSQIAIEYCFRFQEEHPERHVFWVHASSPERFRQAYDEIAGKQSIPGGSGPDVDKMQLVCDWLKSCKTSWLMILDNADTDDTFQHPASSTATEEQMSKPLMDYIPRSTNGSILVTTRDRRVGETLTLGEPPISVNLLANDEAQAMFRLKIPKSAWSEVASLTLLDSLEYLPLAITQAAAFIRQNPISIEAYVNILNAEDVEIKRLLQREHADPRRDSRSPNSVMRTWKVSFDHIARQDRYACNILSVMAFFDRHRIPISLLREDAKTIVEFTIAIGTLQAYSLVQLESNSSDFAIHRLVQLSVQNWLELEGTLTTFHQKALEIIEQQLPEGTFDQWKICAALMPHAQAVVDQVPESPDLDMHRAEILRRMAEYERGQGRYNSSVDRWETVINVLKQNLGPQHPDTLASTNDLVAIYLHQCRYEEANIMQVNNFEICSRVLGPEHLITLIGMSQLASIHRRQGRYTEAISLGIKVLNIRKRVLPQDHPLIATSMSNLAASYSNQGRYKEAAELQEEALDLFKQVPGPEPLTILVSKNNLAVSYLNQGHFKKATALQVEVFETRERLLGREHPSTLVSMDNLAMNYSEQGNFDKAAILQVEVLEIRERLFGREDPGTIGSMNNLASTYYDQGRYEEAVLLGIEALTANKQILGPEHPATLTCMSNLGVFYIRQAQYEKSILLLTEVIELRKQVLGQEHPHTIASMNSLVAALSRQGQCIEATAP